MWVCNRCGISPENHFVSGCEIINSPIVENPFPHIAACGSSIPDKPTLEQGKEFVVRMDDNAQTELYRWMNYTFKHCRMPRTMF